MYKKKHQNIKTLLGVITLASFLSFSGTASALNANALPTKGKITYGKGSISTSGKKMTVKQSSQKMIANWKTFNIGTNANVTFRQPNSDAVALNKIYDHNPSQILGSLSANGNIYLINPSGIVFGEGAQINVGGLIASSLKMRDKDFITGKYTFINNGHAGSVINQGNINAGNGGVVALIGPRVINEGNINAESGDVLLAAGKQVTLAFEGDNLISYTINKGAVDAWVENSGYIQADGGMVVLSAEAKNDLTSAVVNNSGVIEARTLKGKSGRILLLSDMDNGTTVVGGTLDAAAPDGGFIETSAAKVQVDEGTIVTTLAPEGTIGTWLIDPVDFTVDAYLDGGDISAEDLVTALNSNYVILSADGSTGTEGNINVNDAVSWSANTTLTLSAYNNVNINANITATGDTAGLTITPNTGSVGGSDFLNNGAVITLSGLTPSLSIADHAYTVINEANGGVSALQAMGTSGYYALGSNIDASATSGWNDDGSGGYYGFAPVGNDTTQFTGTFDGLNHTISNLYINRPSQDYVGLFGYTDSGSSVSNVGLVGGSVTGYYNVGGLVGYNLGDIANSFTTGAVSGNKPVGGLVGENYGGNIDNSYATGTINGYV